LKSRSIASSTAPSRRTSAADTGSDANPESEEGEVGLALDDKQLAEPAPN